MLAGTAIKPLNTTLFALALAACASCATYLDHAPQAHLPRDEARATILRAFEEQPAKFRPLTVEFGDDAIRIGFTGIRRGFVTGGVMGVETHDTYFFDNLAEMKVLRKKNRYQILLSNREGSVRRWVIFYEREKAFSFLDAIHSLAKTR